MMDRAHLLLGFFGILLVAATATKYEPTWESLDSRPLPDWFDDDKFGIFIHWGVYSVPAWGPVGQYAEWYGYFQRQPGSPTQAFHNKTYGPEFPYAAFAPLWKAELFNAQKWAETIVKSGAKYVVPTSKHHDGFALWPSAQARNWNSVDIGPQRDLIGDLVKAFRERELHVGLYYSLYEWYHPLYRGRDPAQYVEQVMLPQLHDLVTAYKPTLIFADGAFEHKSSFWKSKEFLAWLYNDSPVKDYVVVNDRWGSETDAHHGGYYTPEYDWTTFQNRKWEQNSGIDIHSFGYNRNTDAENYYTVEYLLFLLVRCVAFGGNFLLDVGPAADGTIPPIMEQRLLAMGDWLSVNGEAIYKTNPRQADQQEVHINTPIKFSVQLQGNNVFRAVRPGENSSTIIYAGTVDSDNECQRKCSEDEMCLSYTWFHESSDYDKMCYLRHDEFWFPAKVPGASSGRKDHYTVSYTNKKIRSTNDEPVLYAVVFGWPGIQLDLLTAMASENTVVSMLGLGSETTLKWSGSGNPNAPGVIITVPPLTVDQLPSTIAWVFKLTNAV